MLAAGNVPDIGTLRPHKRAQYVVLHALNVQLSFLLISDGITNAAVTGQIMVNLLGI